MFRFIMLGDIVGTPGRQAVAQLLPGLRAEFKPELILANAENSAQGSGLTPEQYTKLVNAGLDGMTLGDHVYRRVQIVPTLETQANIIRPANLPAGAKGRRFMKLTAIRPGLGQGQDAAGAGTSLYVITLLGRVFQTLPIDEPFAVIEQVLAQLPEKNPLVMVEMHAEATSEKVAMGWYLDGRVAAVLGSHTHVATADAQVLPGGTAYITDLGMCGPYRSVIGRKIDRVLTQMTTGMPVPFDVAEEDPRISGVVVDLDEKTRKAVAIQLIQRHANPRQPPFMA